RLELLAGERLSDAYGHRDVAEAGERRLDERRDGRHAPPLRPADEEEALRPRRVHAGDEARDDVRARAERVANEEAGARGPAVEHGVVGFDEARVRLDRAGAELEDRGATPEACDGLA